MINDIAEVIRMKEEKNMADYFEKNMNLSFINFILNEKREIENVFLKRSAYIKGYHLQLTEEVGSDIYNTGNNLAQKMDFKEKKIQYYISNEPEFNAYSIYGYGESVPHIIILNSGLLEKLDASEISFVIAHELAHLYYEHSFISNAFEFVYETFEKTPPLLGYYYVYWKNLTEISADRLAFYLTNDFEASVRTMFKISSGLTGDYLKFDLKGILTLADGTIKELKCNKSHSLFSSHPVNPLRIIALHRFYNLLEDTSQNRTINLYEKLEKIDEEILSVLKKLPCSELEETKMFFLVSAGVKIIKSDRDIDRAEIVYLSNMVGFLYHHAPSLIDDLLTDNSKCDNILQESAQKIKESYPFCKRDILETLTELILQDTRIKNEEFLLLFNIAKEYLEMDWYEIVEIVAERIKKSYLPLY